MKIQSSGAVSLNVEETFARLCNPALHIARLNRDPATVSVQLQPENDGFSLNIVQKRRTMTGGLDPQATDPAHQRFRIDPTRRSLAWTWAQQGMVKVTLAGAFSVDSSGGRTTVRSEADVTVPVPVVGKVLEKIVASILNKSNETLPQDLERFTAT